MADMQTSEPSTHDVTGIVLAAGAGTRMGRAKALLHTPDGESWLARAVFLLRNEGCDRVVVVLGAEADVARPLVPVGGDVTVVIAERWAEGMSHSLRAGLSAATGTAALIALVDMPDLPASVVRRIMDAPISADTLRQAMFHGAPGHPVLVGRLHWDALALDIAGDRGARAFLAAHGVDEVECSDLYDGHDIDTPEQVEQH